MVTDPLKKLWMLAFGDSPETTELFFSTAYAPERCRYLEENGQVTAALYWMDAQCAGQPFAYIYGVGTHPDYRGRGLCRALMESTHSHLKEQGYAAAVLMPAEPGLRKMYRKFGYRDCTALSEGEYTAGERGVPVRSVGIVEYAALRRRLLPENGLIQEGENLAYLASYAGLYAGEDFVMAAVHEKDALFVPELLGNREKIPGILKAMGYEKGTFRMPGREIPFAMYCPLRADAPRPAYLGLAFD